MEEQQLVSESNIIETSNFAVDVVADAALELKENFVKEFVADIATSSYEHGEICDPSNASHQEKASFNRNNNIKSPLHVVTPTESPRNPENETNSSRLSPSSGKSSASPVPPLVGIENFCSSASSTPRDESSSGSPSPIPDDVNGKSAAKDKPSVKLGKDLSLMMQALNSLQTPEEKIAALCKKYADLLDQQKLSQKQLRISQRKQVQAIKEKDQLQTDHSKAISARSKLESLCRELQRRNRAIKEEQNQKSLQEVNLRQEMASEFQSTLDRIQNQMKTAVDGSNKLQSENERIGGKLNEIVEKYQEREAAMEKLVKQHNLQEQLVSAQLEKTILEQRDEREKNAEEKQKLLEQLIERTVLYESKVKQEKELRAQLQYYSEKFEDFQSTLEKSNEVFTSFRTEMDKMSKKLKQAEKYRASIQKKWEDSTKALADTVDYTQQLEIKQARLEKLSRALQSERNELAQRLRQYEDSEKKPKEIPRRKKTTEEKSKIPKTDGGKTTVVNANGLSRDVADSKLTPDPLKADTEDSERKQSEDKKNLEKLTPVTTEPVEAPTNPPPVTPVLPQNEVLQRGEASTEATT